MTHLDICLVKSIFAHLVFILVGEEIHHFRTMVSLKLDHLAHVLILDNSAIASCKKPRSHKSQHLLSLAEWWMQGVRLVRHAKSTVIAAEWTGGERGGAYIYHILS